MQGIKLKTIKAMSCFNRKTSSNGGNGKFAYLALNAFPSSFAGEQFNALAI